jgi:hypothetical protein
MKSRAAAVAMVVILPSIFLPVLCFLYWPTCLSDPRIDLTVTAVKFFSPGKFRIEYEQQLIYGWGISWNYDLARDGGSRRTVTEDYWSFDDKRKFRWPRTTRGLSREYDATMEEGPPGIPADEATMRRHILIRPGVFRLRPGEKLMFYRGASRNGKDLEGFVEMKPEVPDEGPLEYKPK